MDSQVESMRALSTVQNSFWLGGGGGGGGLLLLAERACSPARWFTIWRALFSSSGVSLLFWGFQVIPSSVLVPFFQCVCAPVCPKTDSPCQRKDVDGYDEDERVRG